MDYEKKYKEALERARQFSEKPYLEDSKDIVDYIFPELKESNDEKIRKEIIYFFNRYFSVWREDIDKYKSWLAWLEKQGEQKPVFEMKTPEESLGIDSDTYNKIVDECIYGEQKHTDKVEPKFKVGDEIITKNEKSLTITRIDEKGYWSNDLFICDFDSECIWDLVPADWSEEDEDMIQALDACIDAAIKSGMNYISFDSKSILIGKVKNWLKSLKNIVQLQNGYNPYKEVVKSIAEMCKHYDKASHSGLRDFYDNVKVKCKEAIEYDEKYPQKQWKPSDEQMKALDDVISSKDIKYDVLSELYKDLKKLREE